MQHPELIYKITTRDVSEQAAERGHLDGTPLDRADGYIHFSTAAQLPRTLFLHYKGAADLTLLAVRTSDVLADLRWEPSRGGALFPHLYAPLPMSAVAWVKPISVDDDGRCDLPGDVT